MKLDFFWNNNDFTREANKLRLVLGVEGKKLIRDETRLFVRDCAKLTPPCGRNAITESFAAQRKRGENAIKKDIGKLWTAVNSLDVVKTPTNEKLSKEIKRKIRKRDFLGLEGTLRALGLPVVQVIKEAYAAMHLERRNRQGRVKAKGMRVVLNGSSINKYLKTLLSHVGKAKSGWVAAANQLGVKLPAWITRHRQPGLWNDQSHHPTKPYIEVGNLVPFIQEAGREKRIIESAMKTRIRSMRIRMEKIGKYLERKANT